MVETVDELLHKQRDILLPAAQGRQFDPHHIDAVIEIFPKDSLADLLVQVTVGSYDDPGIADFALNSPERLVGSLLEHSQKTHL